MSVDERIQRPVVTPIGKIGAALFAIWGLLHAWVGYDGLKLYGEGVDKQWDFFVGGKAAPLAEFKMPIDPVTMHVHANFLLNFCLDVGGYGLLGIVIAYLIYKRASWFAYFLGVAMIGICDMSFMFLQLTSGIISVNIPSVSGPVIWAIATVLTPFGMPSLKATWTRYKDALTTLPRDQHSL